MKQIPIFAHPTLVTEVFTDGDANLLSMEMCIDLSASRTQYIKYEDETVAIRYGDATSFHSLEQIIQEWMKAKQAKLI